MAERAGDWLQTYKGIQFWPLDPRPEEILIEDIAHALSLQCRFSGHTRVHYSVAEHCVRVAVVVPPALALWGLLHDAAEAYLVDLPRPLKRLPSFVGYRETERALMVAICDRYRLPHEMPPEVGAADQVLLATEARDLLGPRPAEWGWMPEPLVATIRPWGSATAERMFLSAFRHITVKQRAGEWGDCEGDGHYLCAQECTHFRCCSECGKPDPHGDYYGGYCTACDLLGPEDEPEPIVCPGCHAIGPERCAPQCPDAAIALKDEEAAEER